MSKQKVKKVSKKQQEKKETKRKGLIVLILLLLLVVGGGITYKMLQTKQPADLVAGDFLPEGKDAKQMSKKELEEAAQKAVDDSKFTLNIFPDATFPDGKSEGSIYIKNEATNAYPISVELIEEKTGDVIYESGAIEPGYEVTKGTLSKNLSKGKYKGTAKVSIYDPETKAYRGQTAAEMEIEVEN